MERRTSIFSSAFEALYCNPAVYVSFSDFHPISFARVLPFQPGESVADDHQLVYAEEAYLALQSDQTRQGVIEGFSKCGLLTGPDPANLISVIDSFDAEFFELMGDVYTSARMFRCALRWYRERIRRLESEPISEFRVDYEGVYVSVGYCLYALGLFEEAIAWSKACIGPRQTADTVSRALIAYEAAPAGGALQVVERAGPRVRYHISTFDMVIPGQCTPRLKAAMKGVAPFQDVYMDWVTSEWKIPELSSDGYPFQPEFDATPLVGHRMNLIYATCWRADALVARGYPEEAKRLLNEAAMMEPEAECLCERIRSLR